MQTIRSHFMHPACRRTRPFLLFHWAPVSRRRSIQRRGLKVGSRHAVHSKGWRATYLCFSDSPSFAWAYSAGTTRHPEDWDLWMVWSTAIPGRIAYRFDHKGRQPAELRCFVDVPARSLWRVGTREHRPRRQFLKNDKT